MVRIAVEQFQQNPSDALRQVEAGETLVIVRNNSPIAELTPAKKKRPIGLCKGQFTAPADIVESLPPDVLRDFEGT